jgi:hypothetical protein
VTPGGLVYHALNRSVAGLPLFRTRADYEAFERIGTCIARSRSYGSEEWQHRQAEDLGLWHTLRREGRPSKQTVNQNNSLRPRFDARAVAGRAVAGRAVAGRAVAGL